MKRIKDTKKKKRKGKNDIKKIGFVERYKAKWIRQTRHASKQDTHARRKGKNKRNNA